MLATNCVLKIAFGFAKFSNFPMDVVGSAHNMLFPCFVE